MKNDPAMQELAKAARFEAGKPADPTKHMSPEDAAKWKDMNDKHRDKFKTASNLGLDGLLDYMFNGLEHEPSESSAVQQLISWGVNRKFAQELVNTWWANPPSLVSRNLMDQQEYAENLIQRLAEKNHVRLASSKVAGDIPADVERYVKETQESSPDYDDAKVWAVAWSRYCKYKNPGSEHCKMNTNDYFKNAVDGLTKMAGDEDPQKKANKFFRLVGQYLPYEIRLGYPKFHADSSYQLSFKSEGMTPDVETVVVQKAIDKALKLRAMPKDIAGQNWEGKPIAKNRVIWVSFPSFRELRDLNEALRGEVWRGDRWAAQDKMAARSLSDIADEIRSDWKKVYFGAVSYLDAMGDLRSIDDDYGQDSGSSIVAYFLSNATTWKGEVAKKVKKELQDMLKKSRKYANDPDMMNLAARASSEDAMREAAMPDWVLDYEKEYAKKHPNKSKNPGKNKKSEDILAEGCPDNLEGEDCDKWEANTDKYQDVVKDKHRAGQVNDTTKSEPDNSMRKNRLDPMANWNEGEIDLKDDPRKHPSEGSMIPGLEDRLAAASDDALGKSAAPVNLIPPAPIRSKIPGIGEQDGAGNPKVWIKYFSPYSGAYWLVTEWDGQDEMFGWAEIHPGMGELGYMSLSELKSARFRGAPAVERDLHFTPKPLAQAKAEERRNRGIDNDDDEARLASLTKAAIDPMMAELEMLADGCPDNLDDAQCKEWESNTDKYKDVVKDKHQAGLTDYDQMDEADANEKLENMVGVNKAFRLMHLWTEAQQAASGNGFGWKPVNQVEVFVNKARRDNYPDKAIAHYIYHIQGGKLPKGLRLASDAVDEKAGKFDKGKPADPTKDMSPEDAAEWKKQNDEHKDKFKTAGVVWGTMTVLVEAGGQQGAYIVGGGYRAKQTAMGGDLGRVIANAMAGKFMARFEHLMGPEVSGISVDPPSTREIETLMSQVLVNGSGSITYDGDTDRYLVARHASDLNEAWGNPIAKTAAQEPSGLYGYTRAIQSSCESSIRKMMATATKVAKEAYRKDENVAPFLAAHAKRSNSLSAKILVAAMKTIGPKVASEMRKAELKAEAMPADRLTKAAARKYGLYGYAAKTASLGLHACTTMRETAGHVASEMHGRKADSHKLITGFLSSHAKEARCMYSKMLCASYPDADRKTASIVAPTTVGDWLTWGD